MSDSVSRLTIEAGKYHGLTAGETIEKQEVVLQAEANGYSDREARAMLEGKGQEIEIPDQANLFGDWPGNQELTINSSTGGNSAAPAPCTNSDQTLVESFRKWLEGKEPLSSKYYPDHAYSRKSERAKYAKAKDCDRAVQSRWPTFSTVSIVVNPSTDQSPSEQAQSLYTDDVRQARAKVLKDLGVWQNYAGLRLKAPRPTSTGGKSSPETHGHILLWLPGRDYSREDFMPILEAHPVDQDPEATQIQEHVSANVETPERALQKGSGLDSERGDTTALPHEAAMNLPMLKHDAYEARKCPDYIEEWYAWMKAGRDDDPTTRGLRRTQAFGQFNEYAQSAKDARNSPLGISQPARNSLFQAVSQLAQIPTPETGLETPVGGRLKASMESLKPS